jgi:hypothetical protein
VLPAEQLQSRIARRREQWKKYQNRPDPRGLVFIDESPDQVLGRLWVKTNMASLRGWVLVGQRRHANVPYGHWKTMNYSSP